MDLGDKDPLNQLELDMWQRREQKEISSPFLELNPAVERGESRFLKMRVFRERKCNFSLDFSALGPSVRVGPRSKVVIRDKGYAWASVSWSFDNSKRYGSSPTRLFSVLRALLMIWSV